MNRKSPMPIGPTMLSNEIVTLEPIALSHADDFVTALDDSVFAYMAMRSSVRTKNEVRRYIEFQIARPDTVAFSVIDNATKRAIGSTSYMNIRPDHYGLEIGSTWIATSARSTKVNPAMKHLMLKHAFEELHAIRVELETDERNAQSRAAILKLGAEFEGILRNHMIMADGHFRGSAMYSITLDQWPAVERGLLDRIST